MPYKTIDDLPERIKSHLPKDAKIIFLKAFNNAWQQYKNPLSRKGESTQEEIAFKVAWSAVKRVYKKDEGGNWIKK